MKVVQLHEYTPEQFSNPSPTPTSTQFQLNFHSTSSQHNIKPQLQINLSLNINVNLTSTLTLTQYGCDIKETQSCLDFFCSRLQQTVSKQNIRTCKLKVPLSLLEHQTIKSERLWEFDLSQLYAFTKAL